MSAKTMEQEQVEEVSELEAIYRELLAKGIVGQPVEGIDEEELEEWDEQPGYYESRYPFLF